MEPKHQLLLAICEEYENATPNVSSISAWSLNMNQDVFNGFGNAMIKAGYIEGALPTKEGLELAKKLKAERGEEH